MKAQLLSNDEQLLIELKKVFDDVEIIQSIEKITEKNIIISDYEVEYSELSHIDTKEKNVFYLLHNRYEPFIEKNIKAFCHSRDIYLIPPRLTIKQIVQSVKQIINPEIELKTNVVSFFAPVSNIGTTTIALSVARIIQKHSKSKKVGVLLLNAWSDGTETIEYKGSYLDEIKNKLSGKLIQSKEEFLSMFHMFEKDSLYILGGNRNTKMERLFTKEEIHYLIEKSKECFDLVIIDAGCHFDNANMVQALKESDLRYLVINQQQKAMNRFNRLFNEILYPLGYNYEHFMMIVNQYEDKSYLPNTKEIYEQIRVPLLTTVNKSQYGLNAENEQKLLISYENESFKESILHIAKSIASIVEIELEFEEKKRKRFFSFS